MRRAARVTMPLVGRESFAARRSSVDLPMPLGPLTPGFLRTPGEVEPGKDVPSRNRLPTWKRPGPIHARLRPTARRASPSRVISARPTSSMVRIARAYNCGVSRFRSGHGQGMADALVRPQGLGHDSHPHGHAQGHHAPEKSGAAMAGA